MNSLTADGLIQYLSASMLANYRQINLSINYTDDLYATALSVCESATYSSFLRSLPLNQRVFCNRLNGLYIPPKDIDSQQFILISNKQKADGYSHISTAVHEIQHAINHTLFALNFCNGNFSGIEHHMYNTDFQVWDEFAARRTGHFVYTTITMPTFMGFSSHETKSTLQEQRQHRAQQILSLRKQPVSLPRLKESAGIIAMFAVWKNTFNVSPDGLDNWGIKFLQILDCYQSIEDIDFFALHANIDHIWDAMHI